MSYQFGDSIAVQPTKDYMKFGVPFQDLGTDCEWLQQVNPAIGNFKFTPCLANVIHGWKQSLQGRNLIVNNPDFCKSGSPLRAQIERYVCPWGPYPGLYFQIQWTYDESWGVPKVSTSGSEDYLIWPRNMPGSHGFTAAAVTIPDHVPPYDEWAARTGPLGATVTLVRLPDANDCPDSPIQCTMTLSSGGYDYTYTPTEYIDTHDCNAWTNNAYNFSRYFTVALFAGDPIGVLKTLTLTVISYVIWQGPAEPGWEPGPFH
jgi:hypothetical protein